jgi:hypothetical protein
MTKARIMQFCLRHSYKMQVLTPDRLDEVWKMMKQVRHPRYTKAKFVENYTKGGFNTFVADGDGKMIAVWMARGVRYKDEDVAWVELTWHCGSAKGLYALAFLGMNFVTALRAHTKILYYSAKNPWKQSVPLGRGYYYFDSKNTLEELWAAAETH